VGWDKEIFTGRAALESQREEGVNRWLTAVVSPGRQPLREGGELRDGGSLVGTLTSGNYSPVRGCGIGLGFADADLAAGTKLQVGVRGKELDGEVVTPPFVKKSN
jgi:aminomethyltransferase